MIWKGREESSNVEDRRGSGGPIKGGIGVILIAVITYFITGGDIGKTLNVLINNEDSISNSRSYKPTSESNEQAKFISVVLKDTEDVWEKIFRDNNMRYPKPKLVLFTGSTKSGCGQAQSEMGPFYCPIDQKVYIDLSFFNELSNSYGVKGDFARAYVLAHEVGHHIQNLLGILKRVNRQKMGLSKVEKNRLSIRVELQADCFAGIWANHAQKMKQILEVGDIDEALEAASSVGDDTLQKRARGYVIPDSFTHGTSQQRIFWFKRGFESGNIKYCNTF